MFWIRFCIDKRPNNGQKIVGQNGGRNEHSQQFFVLSNERITDSNNQNDMITIYAVMD